MQKDRSQFDRLIVHFYRVQHRINVAAVNDISMEKPPVDDGPGE